jgi:hypothetical protein
MTLVGFNELDPELSNAIKNMMADIEESKKEIEAVRLIVKSVMGFSKEEVEREIKRSREEARAGCREIVKYCQEM